MPSTPYEVTDRRPIAARGWPIWHHTARWLARRGVSPNAISIAGMICGIAAGVALSSTSALGETAARFAFLVAAILIQLRLLANLLDGMVAIESNRASQVGELYNEVPDRISDTATLIGAGFALTGSTTLGYLAAIAAIFTAYVRAMGKAAGVPQQFCGPMAKQHRMALLTVVAPYCGFMPGAWTSFEISGRIWGVVSLALLIIVFGCIVTAARRLVRIAANLKRSAP